MKCVDCGEEFEEVKIERDIKVTLSNPGVVMFKAKASECPKCHQNYIDEEDIGQACRTFEVECKKKIIS